MTTGNGDSPSARPDETDLVIEREGFTLRPVRGSDAAALAPLLDDPALHTHTGGNPRTLDALRAWFTALETRVSPDNTELWLTWVVLADAQSCGYVQATVHGDDADLAWVIGAAFQNRGIASTSIRMVVSWATSVLNVQSFRAAIAPSNAASQRVAEKTGFARTGETIDGEVIWRRGLAEAGSF